MDENKNAPAATAPEDDRNSKSPAKAKNKPEPKELDNSVDDVVESAPAPGPAPVQTRARIRKDFVVSGQFTDDVLVSQLNKRDSKRKSLSVLHMQRALANAGYSEAAADKGGKFGVLTASAVEQWQAAEGYSGDFTLDQIEKLFIGDPNVTVKS